MVIVHERTCKEAEPHDRIHLARTLDLPYAQAVTQVRDGLAGVGFGVLTEIDIAATLKTKLDVDVAPKIILGACRPQLAHQALQADPASPPCSLQRRGQRRRRRFTGGDHGSW